MKKTSLFILLAILCSGLSAQITLVRQGESVSNGISGFWEGVNIPRSVPTRLSFLNNSITSVNSSGYLLQAGDETPLATNNNLNGAVITGNRLTWNGTDGSSITHGMFIGYNINYTVKYNFLDKTPYGILFKSGTDAGSNMTYSSGYGAAYNIIKNARLSLRMKGINGVQVYNNTFYSNKTSGSVVLIDANRDRVVPAASTGARIKNNIFYTVYQIYNIAIESGCLSGFESDYNVFYCEAGTPMFSVDGAPKTFAEWQAMGYDLHSVVVNPNFINTTDFVPQSRLNYGVNLGTGWQTGLSTTATWAAGASPATTNQNGTWQAGARLYSEITAPAPAPPASPVFVSAAIGNSTPARIDISYNLALASIIPPVSSFSVMVNSVSRGVNSVAVSGSVVLLTLASPVVFGDVVSVAYTKPSVNPLQTPEGGQAASVTAQAVTNKVVPPVPVLVSSSVENSTPSILTLVYNLNLAAIIPAVPAFSVTVNSTARTISSVSVSSNSVRVTLASPVVYGDVVKVSYTKPATNPLQTPQGGQASSISGQAVTNSVATPVPQYVSSSVENTAPSVLEMTYNLTLAANIPAVSAFSVSINSTARPISSVTVSGTSVRLTLASPVAYGDVVRVSYTKPATNPLQTPQGGQASSISGQAVTNRVAPPVPQYVSSSVENTAPSVLEMTYNLTLAANIPAVSAFAVTVNSASRAINSVTVSGTKVRLTMASPVIFGDIVKVSYTKPSANPLQTATGAQAASVSAQTVINRVAQVVQAPAVINTPPVVVINTQPSNLSGFVGELDATGSYDVNRDQLTYSWIVPSNIAVSSTTGSRIRFLGPIVSTPQKVEFKLNISDGKVVQSKSVVVEILPYKPELETADVINIEESSFQTPHYPHNILDGDIGTMWSANGDNQWLVIELEEPFNIQHVKLAFQPGQKKESYFDVLGSEDNVTWEPILTKSSSCGFSGDLQVFDFPESKSGKEYTFVKLIGHSNSVDTWNHISEFRLFGYPHRNPTEYEEQPVKLYPNPAREVVKVKIEDGTMNPEYIRIVSLTGRLMQEYKVSPGISDLQIPLDLKEGIYIVQFVSGNLTLFAQKLIVSI